MFNLQKICPMCGEPCMLVDVISPTNDKLYRCSECGSLGTEKVWIELQKISKLEKQIKEQHLLLSKLITTCA